MEDILLSPALPPDPFPLDELWFDAAWALSPIMMPEHKEIANEKMVIRVTMGDRLFIFVLDLLRPGPNV